jgi:predicted histone-like DNA-binding protein
MKYKMIKRVNPQDRTQEKWYASPVNDGKITKTDLAKEIVNMSALSRGDVSSVIENLLDILPKYLLMGKSVNMGVVCHIAEVRTTNEKKQREK